MPPKKLTLESNARLFIFLLLAGKSKRLWGWWGVQGKYSLMLLSLMHFNSDWKMMAHGGVLRDPEHSALIVTALSEAKGGI